VPVSPHYFKSAERAESFMLPKSYATSLVKWEKWVVFAESFFISGKISLFGPGYSYNPAMDAQSTEL
jgi:hypothetical protein